MTVHVKSITKDDPLVTGDKYTVVIAVDVNGIKQDISLSITATGYIDAIKNTKRKLTDYATELAKVVDQDFRA